MSYSVVLDGYIKCAVIRNGHIIVAGSRTKKGKNNKYYERAWYAEISSKGKVLSEWKSDPIWLEEGTIEISQVLTRGDETFLFVDTTGKLGNCTKIVRMSDMQTIRSINVEQVMDSFYPGDADQIRDVIKDQFLLYREKEFALYGFIRIGVDEPVDEDGNYIEYVYSIDIFYPFVCILDETFQVKQVLLEQQNTTILDMRAYHDETYMLLKGMHDGMTKLQLNCFDPRDIVSFAHNPSLDAFVIDDTGKIYAIGVWFQDEEPPYTEVVMGTLE